MSAFLAALATQSCLQHALAAGVLASIACGIVGSYVVVKRIGYLAGGVAHTVLGGMGVAYFLGKSPIGGALVAALLAAAVIAWVNLRLRQHEDTIIGALWAVGMAIGVIFISRTPGYNVDLMSYLFGNIALVCWSEVRLILGLNVVIGATVLVCHKRLLAICLDQEQAELQGISVLGTNLILLCLVALTVICLTQVVGLILVIALLSLPAATAAHYVGRMGPLLLVSTLLCAVLTTVPRIAVYGTRIDPASAIVLCAGAVYLLSVLGRRFCGRFRRA